MNRKILIQVIAGILVLSMLSCKKSKGPGRAMAPVTVAAYTVEPRDIVYYDSYPGTVTALNEVPLRSQVAGYITGIFFKEGSKVMKGQKLYEIDRRKYQAALEQVKASVSISEANFEKAQRDADRYTALNEQNAIAKQIYEDAITNLEGAKMQVVEAKSALVNAETDYNYSVITAPFQGTIGFSAVKSGAYIVPGQTLLNTISSDDPVGVDFIVNEKSLPGFVGLKEKEAKAMNKADSTFRLLLPDNSLYSFNGTLSVIDRAINSQTGTITIRVVFPNKAGDLKPGMNCRVKVLDINSGSQLVVPSRAIIEQMGEFFVYKIDSSKVKQTRIEPGLNLGEFLEVRKGLKPGDVIVLEGIQKVFNGSMVRIAGEQNAKKSVALNPIK
jgi:membrane fusion protein, multidrug efflux system